jgi:glycosyltransferase involved in cell wall biosynthesis
MRVSLIVPAPFDAISGGYGYDRRIAAELRASGHNVAVVELMGAFPVADEAAQRSARAAWNDLPRDTTPVIDGLALPAFRDLEDGLSARGAVGLIHHPVSLETGLDAAHRSALEETERRLFSRLTRLIVTSETTADTLVARFQVARARIRVVTPGTDEAPRCPSLAPGTMCEILTIGTLVPRKGHDVLLRALASLPDQRWHLTLVGSPDREPGHARSLRALAKERDIAHRVSFAGELVGTALDAAWAAADIFTLATHYEGYGMAIAEALKRGLPVVVTAGGAAGDLIAPGSGRVCPVGDHAQLAESLRDLIDDRDLRRAMAGQAWQTGQTLPSWQTQAALFADALG